MMKPYSAALAALIGLAPIAAAPTATAQIGEWSMQTSQLDTDYQTGDFSAPHHVLLKRADGSTIEADRGTGNYKKKFFQMYGKVSIHDTSGTLTGSSVAPSGERGPSTLTCDELHVDSSAKVYNAIGNVHYEQGSTTANAAQARLDDKAHRLDMQGHVHFVQGDRTLDSDRARYDTLSQDGRADGNVTMLFPGAINASIATPKPIIIKTPKIPH